MGRIDSIQWPIVAIPSAAMTRGQRIRRERNRRHLTIAELAAQIEGVSTRNLGRIENDKTKDSAATVLVEDYLGLGPFVADEEPDDSLVRLDELSNLRLVRELLSRLDQANPIGTADSVPLDVLNDPDTLPGPPETKRRKRLESDG